MIVTSKRGGTVADELSQLTLVRPHVRELLARSPSFRRLPPDRQNQVAHDTAQVAAYLVAPEGIPANKLPGAVAIVHAGTDASSTAVAEVDFPSFVTNLIHNTFQAIVDSSIQQMDAYAKLVSSVAQSVSQFLHDPVSDDHSRRSLAAIYPEYFDCDPKPDCHKLHLRNASVKSEAIARLQLLPLESRLHTLDQNEIDRILVPAGRRRLAAQRQQLLASMVLMGINRIVVTSGHIPAG